MYVEDGRLKLLPAHSQSVDQIEIQKKKTPPFDETEMSWPCLDRRRVRCGACVRAGCGRVRSESASVPVAVLLWRASACALAVCARRRSSGLSPHLDLQEHFEQSKKGCEKGRSLQRRLFESLSYHQHSIIQHIYSASTKLIIHSQMDGGTQSCSVVGSLRGYDAPPC